MLIELTLSLSVLKKGQTKWKAEGEWKQTTDSNLFTKPTLLHGSIILLYIQDI